MNSLRRFLPRSLLSAVIPATLLVAVSPCASALDAGRSEVTGFIDEMSSEYGFDSGTLGQVFSQVETRQSIIDAMSRPAEKRLSWDEYRAIFITDRRIERGHQVAASQAAALGRAAASGVPASVILAIVGVETFYGERTGSFRVIDALSTLAFDYPPRADFFRKELQQFLLMSREESLDPLDPKGSYAGAMGIPQFMPSSFRAYAVDGGGDGHRNLWSDWDDVFASVANYLEVHGWRPGEPVMATASVQGARLDGLEFGSVALDQTVGSLRQRGVSFETPLPDSAPAVLLRLPGDSAPEYRVGFSNFYVITRYNRSQLYASAVSDLADALGRGAAPAADPESRPWSSGPGTGR
jgi:membrane-bound lytic murein transglycosylase B